MLRTLLLLFLPFSLLAQDRNFWQKTNAIDVEQNSIINYTTEVEDQLYFELDKTALSSYLEQAPDRYSESSSSISIQLPNPSGEFDTFKIFSTQTMARDLAEKFPEVRSYIGYNQDNTSHTARITITPTGFYIMTLGSSVGQTFINPYALNSNIHTVFSKSQCNYQQSLDCQHTEEHFILEEDLGLTTHFIQEGELRKYRLAVAANVQYSEFHWQAAGLDASDSDTAKKGAVQAAIVVSIDRVNQIFERDFGVTLELVANNDDVIFLGDPNDDPYDNTDHLQMIEENQVVLDNEIGSFNYDIGHVFNTNGGGLATTPSVCNDNTKARGSTGLPNPVGDPFDISIAAHEFGHQFGANHTQNNDTNRNDDTAVETGSGTTIMGYAGISAPNVQNTSDAMFHYISISEVKATFSSFSGFFGDCAEIITIANDAPIVEAVPNYTIPQNTPFMLEAEATDPDDDDLTYSWEQFDNEIATMPPEPTATEGPAFRTFLPTSNPIRYFPSMSTLTSGNYANTWEVLSTVNRTYNFGVVVRDNNPLGGQVTKETTTVTVDDSAGPFRVTSQNNQEDPWLANDTQTITWDVANTDNPSGIDAQEVDILLSLDGGETFTEVVLENTPNDGEEDIVVPDVITSNARIMVKASTNIFFDINDQAFAIGTAFTPEYCEAGSESQDFTNISQVEFNTIDNTSGNDGYSDFTSIYTTVQRGETYSISVREEDNTVYDGSQVFVWIDFNQDGTFDGPGEKVIETDSFDGDFSIYPFGGDITIPTDAQLGETTMRIRIHSADFGTPNNTPCGNSTFGEVEDYRIVIYDDFVYYDDQWEPNLPTGLSTNEDNILVIDGETVLSGTTQTNDLTLQISSKLSVEGVLNVAGDIENNGKLVFLSDENGSGQLGDFSGTISRAVEVERYIPSGRAFRFLSSPVGGSSIADTWQKQIHITGEEGETNGFDETATNNPSMFTYNHAVEEQNQPWETLSNTNQNLEAGKPYRLLVRGGRDIVDLSNNESPSSPVTLKATGQMQTGTFMVETSNFENNYSFVGNPYQAMLDLENLDYGNGVNTNHAYYWDPNLSDFGGFVTVAIPTTVPNPSSSNANHFLRPGQAMFLRNNDTGNDFSISINENNKATAENQTQVFGESQNLDYINMRIYKSENYNQDEAEEDAVGLRFSDSYSNLITDLDATKKGNSGLNLALLKQNSLFSIQHREMPQVDETIAIFVNNFENDDYVFWVDLNNVGINKDVYLKDNYEDSLTLLEDEINEIHFSVDLSISESFDPFRFELLFDHVSFSSEEFSKSNYTLYPNPTEDGVFVIQSNRFTNEPLKIQIYNILGQQLFTTNKTGSSNGEVRINAESLSTATYIIKIENENGEVINDKLIVK